MISRQVFTALAALAAGVRAQQACTLTAETHPALSWSTCAEGGSCTEKKGSVVVDSNWRWTHAVSGSNNCYTGNTWDSTLCPDGETCASQCCLDGADYAGTYGVTTSGDELKLKYVQQGPYSKNIGSRMYLMQDEDNYEMFSLLGNEFTFDVDVSQLVCGLNGALYFVSMDQDGGMARYPENKAGAKFGTGYCDAQCAKDLKFIGGKANVEGWTPSKTDENSGQGDLGACCAEMDIWEANAISNAYTPHTCVNNEYHTCLGDDCGGTYSTTRYAGDCDPDGCDFNPFRQGDTTFYGQGAEFTVDTTKKVTVVTQFIKGSDGVLSEIKRFYVQNGKVIPNTESTISGNPGNSITDEFCSAQKLAFGDDDIFKQRGGFAQMSAAVEAPMVLVMSLWGDHHSQMQWLDSTYPADKTGPGGPRGSCPVGGGLPADLVNNSPGATVAFSAIKFGPIGSTFDSASVSDPVAPAPSASASAVPTSKAPAASSSKAPAASSKAPIASSAPLPAPAPTTTLATVSKPAPTAAPVENNDDDEEDDEECEDDDTEPTQAPAPVPTSSKAPVEVPVPTSAPVEVPSQAPGNGATVTVTVTAPNTHGPVTVTVTAGAGNGAATPAPSAGVGANAIYQQCGGLMFTGSKECAEGLVCEEMNEYYHQCVSA